MTDDSSESVLLGDGRGASDGGEAARSPATADDAPMLISRDVARRLAQHARLLPRHVAEENDAVVIDAHDNSYVIGAVDPENFPALRNVARALRVGTRHLAPTRVSRAHWRTLMSIAYGRDASSAPTHSIDEESDARGATGGGPPPSSSARSPRAAASSAPQASVSWGDIDPRAAEATSVAARLRADDEFDYRRGGDTRSNANFVVQEAVNRGASDIHFEPGPEFGRIRFRVDGVMYPFAADVPAARMEHLVNALADMAGVNSYELPHAPCDSSIDRRVMLPDGQIVKTTLRFASSPALYGVDVTIRLNINAFFDFHEIGFEEIQLHEIFEALKQKNGIVLVTGETGSGKSNTLEAIIRHLEVGDQRKVIQVGDPIEFPNPKRTQIPIKSGCDWDQALKISLRKDPNIFSPGEFRDEREARMVFRAGRTGHLVPTTVHTNDIATTFDRLSDLGVEPYNQGPSLRLVISQQLVRKLCPLCREPDPAAPFIAQRLMRALFPDRPDLQRLETDNAHRPWLHRATGCAECYGIGYRGRTVIAEVLRVTPDLARLISRGMKGGQVVERAVRDERLMTLAEAAARKLVAGVTSFDEVEHLLSDAARRRSKNGARRGGRDSDREAAVAEVVDAEYAEVIDDEDWPLGM